MQQEKMIKKDTILDETFNEEDVLHAVFYVTNYTHIHLHTFTKFKGISQTTHVRKLQTTTASNIYIKY